MQCTRWRQTAAVYALVVGKNGPTLKENAAGSGAPREVVPVFPPSARWLPMPSVRRFCVQSVCECSVWPGHRCGKTIIGFRQYAATSKTKTNRNSEA
jgi:hypothetical protein